MTDFSTQAKDFIDEQRDIRGFKTYDAQVGQLEQANYKSSTGAVRASANKLKMSMVPLDLLDGTARVFTLGAAKYGRENFRNGFPPEEVLDSLLRHTLELQNALRTGDKSGDRGSLLDRESKEAHVHHMSCNVLILIDSMRKAGWNV